MHILHRILVHLPGDVPASEGESRGEYLERIRSYAETETEDCIVEVGIVKILAVQRLCHLFQLEGVVRYPHGQT